LSSQYQGQNVKIRETLNNLILKAPQEWHTQVALPFVKIVGTTVEWDEIRFDVRLLQRVPYEGISRMSTSLRRRHRDRVVRRGIGLTIESDFYATEAGRAHFADQLTSIRYCVQETCNFDAIYAYLTCGNYDFRYDMQKGLRPRRSVRTAMAHEVNMFAIVQKDQMGLDKAVEEVKYRMSRYSVTPNMIIIPPQLALYMSLAPEQKLTYPLGGPAAQAAFDAGLAGFETTSFRGLGIMTSTPYEVSDDQDSVQMLQRSAQVGEFYRMTPPSIFDIKNALIPTYMDIVIYDEESDRHVHIGIEKAMYATSYGHEVMDPNADIFGLDEYASHYLGGFNVTDEEGDDVWKNNETKSKFKHHNDVETSDKHYHVVLHDTWLKEELAEGAREREHAYDKGKTTTPRDFGERWTTYRHCYLTYLKVKNMLLNRQVPMFSDVIKLIPHAVLAYDSPDSTLQPHEIRRVQVDAMIQLVRNGIYVPIEIVICRPFIEHLMLSAIVAVAGRDTGATLFGPADMQISANTSVKTIEGHYTCHTKSVITKPQNVCVMRDIMCSGYVAGCNTQFFGESSGGGGLNEPLDPKLVAGAIESRLSFHDDGVEAYDSILAFGVKLNDGSKRDQIIGITPRQLPWDVNRHEDDGRMSIFAGGKKGWEFYKHSFGLETIHHGEDMHAQENQSFISQGSTNNTLCFMGPHRKFYQYTPSMQQLIPGQGHFGPDAIPGDARWRRGESVSLKAARDSMVSIEVAKVAALQ